MIKQHASSVEEGIALHLALQKTKYQEDHKTNIQTITDNLVDPIDTVVLMSGGIDSVGILCWALQQGYKIAALNIRVNFFHKQQSIPRSWMANHYLQQKVSREICHKMGIKLIELEVTHRDILINRSPTVPGNPTVDSSEVRHSYMPEWFGWACGMVGHMNPEIKRFFIGWNADIWNHTEEYPPYRNPHDNTAYIQKMVALQGSSAVVSGPLCNMYKKDIVKMIPEELLMYVTTCWFADPQTRQRCMKCIKCKEFSLLNID